MPRSPSTTSLSDFITSEIARVFAAGAASARAAAPAAGPKRRGRPLGAGKSAAPKAAAPKAAQPARAKSKKSAAGPADRDLETVLAYVSAHPSQRSEEISKGIGGDRDIIKAALATLTAQGKVSRSGYGRGGTYKVR